MHLVSNAFLKQKLYTSFYKNQANEGFNYLAIRVTLNIHKCTCMFYMRMLRTQKHTKNELPYKQQTVSLNKFIVNQTVKSNCTAK